MATQSYKEVNAEEYIVAEEPFFMPTSDEIEVNKYYPLSLNPFDIKTYMFFKKNS